MAGKRRRDEAGDEAEGFSLIGAEDASEIGIKRQRLRVHDRRRGHMFKHTVARDQSKVQYGDQIYHISDNYYMGSRSLAATSAEDRTSTGFVDQVQHWDLRSRDLVAAVIIRKIFEQFLPYLLSLVTALRGCHGKVPYQRAENVTYFENAFGRRSRIDVDIITDWIAFDSLLLQKFFEKRGFGKVQSGSYRLENPAGQKLIVPKTRPHFGQLFNPGGYIRMSIYFDREDVKQDGCPRCRTGQATIPGVEATGPTREFAYTRRVPIESVDGSSQRPDLPVTCTYELIAVRFPKPALPELEPDRPEHFNRVAIGEQVVPLELESQSASPPVSPFRGPKLDVFHEFSLPSTPYSTESLLTKSRTSSFDFRSWFPNDDDVDMPPTPSLTGSDIGSDILTDQSLLYRDLSRETSISLRVTKCCVESESAFPRKHSPILLSTPLALVTHRKHDLVHQVL